MTDALLPPSGIDRLRAALLAANYTGEGVAGRLGPAAVQAANRNDFRPALAATTGGDALDTLIRLFICGQTEPTVTPALKDTALVEEVAGGYRAAVELEPYADWWVVSDLSTSLRPGVPLPADHVLGVGSASVTLAAATVRDPVDSALDLGTGCGVQALHLSRHATTVTATDLSDRALRFAATTAALNGLSWDLRLGDLTGPVRGERFDLVVSNPPFVAGPGDTTHTYRDSGRAGDAVCAELFAAAPGLLRDGGTMQFLANWLHIAGEPWDERVAGWLAGTGLDAWVIQREVSDPIGYVDLWLADANDKDANDKAATTRRQDWLDWFDAHKVDGVGLGLVTLRAGGHTDPIVRIEDLRQPATLTGEIGPWFDRQDRLRATDLRTARLRASPELTLRQDASLGPDGWAVDRQHLELRTGLRWTEEVDPIVVALVGGATGALPLKDQIDLLAAAHDADPDLLTELILPIAAHLVERGFLEVA